MGLSHIFSPDGLTATSFSQGFILKNGSHRGNGEQGLQSKDREGWEGSDCLEPARRSTSYQLLQQHSSFKEETTPILQKIGKVVQSVKHFKAFTDPP